ncbi:DUF2798 domain-containing protein [Streptococcus gallolyticus]|uniref:DUF2798 domain-containing protein n=1 Tax=Streptococcus gallolyticus TaxID=315405 RepID=A0A368UF31_9STRE|nr:DUF2798 domain-containing protein [Streptococcus gallolyticus]RCW17247.1 DUF2798 domain-containing protein [Streptococcus gallolyticus]
MPRNAKEALLFTCMMCGMMVFGMSIWNLVVAGAFSWQHVFLGFVPGFIVAFILDTMVVGPIAKKIAFGIIPSGLKHQLAKILTVSACMVLGMVTCMSLYGMIFSHGLSTISLALYGRTWLTNLVVALPYNLIIVGPIARLLLGKIQKQGLLA